MNYEIDDIDLQSLPNFIEGNVGKLPTNQNQIYCRICFTSTDRTAMSINASTISTH